MGGGEILLLPLIVQRKKLRHRPSISLGQEGILAAGILPFPDGHRLIKPLPSGSEAKLLLTGQGQLQAVYPHHSGSAAAV